MPSSTACFGAGCFVEFGVLVSLCFCFGLFVCLLGFLTHCLSTLSKGAGVSVSLIYLEGL